MTKYAIDRKFHRVPARVMGLVLLLFIAIVLGAIAAQIVYRNELQPYSSNQQTTIFNVAQGSSVKGIGDELERMHIIRSSWAMQLYVHTKELTNKLQAGTYAFSPSESTQQIVTTMARGTVTSKLVTILPGRRIDQVRADLINDGFSVAAVDAALQPAQYRGLPARAFLPASTSTLEGLLWPDSFDKNSSTAPSVIITESLTEMGQHLTSAVQADFASEGLTTYQGLILTSMVEQEVSNPNDQPQVAQVFLTRLKDGMTLGSDVTANYGAIVAGHQPSLSFDSSYNTLIHTGLPPTPISSISASALQATTHPANTNWLYFVTGDNGKTYFATTLAQQQANTAAYCHKLCAEE